ncbi:class I SAM-dependent methyltransferase [Aspergillus ibericus CBS 121593]|uniref:UMTA methyltransferase family protein-like protein n=1 Tax=Aspergillus ibericus CBS 121593 TaxID=1448316 RepID=A0A395GKD5_9EURO|nr:UMTA methyltransferase family protein-like protein [Aspergillus ibericus CBS 121593]RAK95951.1 UMTA methyltransferase family protein-like protein [Aspergillus ibericus CBS 121593]
MTQTLKSKTAGYVLQRDLQASIRLYFQHWMWRRQLGYLLHPQIPIKDGYRVADVACGTGIWLIDLAREHPGVQCDGYDISTEQYPAAGWLPPNVRLETLDLLKPIPEALRGQYDIVHVGLVVLVVENDDPTTVLENLLALLKPGGYLQWDESDFGGLETSSPDASIPHEALDEVKQRVLGSLLAAKQVDFHWVRHLGQYFRDRGATVVDDQWLPIADDIALPWTLQHLMAFAEFVRRIDQPVGTAREWWEVYERAADEAARGGSMRMAMASVVGRKPAE